MKVFDFIMGADSDLMIKDRAFVVGESTAQHEKLLLLTEPGQLKLFPLHAVGIGKYLLDDSTEDDMRARIRNKYELDGLSISRLKIKNGHLDTKVEYK